MGLFARARSLAIPGKTAGVLASGLTGGLLHRSLAFLHNSTEMGAVAERHEEAAAAPVTGTVPLPPAESPPRAADPTPAGTTALTAEELSYRVAAIPAGFAAPVLLFSLLRQVLGLKQAALLSYDSRRHCYSPVASVGLDTTSRHRLRMEPGANPDFNRAATGDVVQVGGEGLAAFREYFSSRQFATLRELVLVPFLLNQRLVGLLVAAKLEKSVAGGRELLQAAMAAAGQLFQQEEEEEEPAADSRPLAERLQALLAACRSRGNPLLLIRLHLEPLLRLAQERFPELERFRLQESLTASCRRLLRGIGEVDVHRPPALNLLVHGMKDPDVPLLLRQLQSALLALLQGLVEAGSVDLQPEFHTVGDDAQPALEFLGS